METNDSICCQNDEAKIKILENLLSTTVSLIASQYLCLSDEIDGNINVCGF